MGIDGDGDGLGEGEGDNEGDKLGDSEGDGDNDGDRLGDSEGEGLADLLGDMLLLTLADLEGDNDTLADTLGDMLTLAETLGDFDGDLLGENEAAEARGLLLLGLLVGDIEKSGCPASRVAGLP